MLRNHTGVLGFSSRARPYILYTYSFTRLSYRLLKWGNYDKCARAWCSLKEINEKEGVLVTYGKGPRMGLNGPYGASRCSSVPLSYEGSDSYRTIDFLFVS